jgi:CheY-specific phosphatase CheX
VFVTFAARFAQEEITEPDELAQASVGEFLNLHNGIFLVNMSNNGVELEMHPQQVEENYTFTNPGKAYIITCSMTWGKFDVLLV